jgi:hypothetical protein
VRAAAAGRVFVLWTTLRGSGELAIVEATAGGPPQVRTQQHRFASVNLLADGRTLATDKGLYSTQWHRSADEGFAVFPAFEPNQYIRRVLSARDLTANEGPWSLMDLPTGKVVAPLPVLPELISPIVGGDLQHSSLALEDRLLVLPVAGLVVTIPAAEDRLVFRTFKPPLSADGTR